MTVSKNEMNLINYLFIIIIPYRIVKKMPFVNKDETFAFISNFDNYRYQQLVILSNIT